MTTFYTLLILAGGQGRRMGGRDKGLVEVDGRPLIDQLLAAVTPAPGRIVISANRNLPAYQRRADTVVSDQRPDYPGPMAGLEAALAVCQGPVLCLPCDLLAPPAAMITGLLNELTPDQVRVAEDDHGLQPLCMALHAQPWQASISAYLDSGGRSVRGWLQGVPLEKVRIGGELQNRNRV